MLTSPRDLPSPAAAPPASRAERRGHRRTTMPLLRRHGGLALDLGVVVLLGALAGWFYAPFFLSDRLGPRDWDWSSLGLYLEHARWGLAEFGVIPTILVGGHGSSALFPAIAEAPVYSPALLLAPFAPVATVIKVHIAMLLGLGTLGYLLLARHLRWPRLVALALYPVLFMSGCLAPRLFIGHLSILPFALAPLALYFLLHGVAGGRALGDAAGLALTLTLMAASGGCHAMVWTLYSLGFFAVVYGALLRRPWPSIRFYLGSVIAFALLSAWTLIPMLGEYAAYSPGSLHGYLSFDQLIAGLTDGRTPWNAMRNYELDYHVIMWWELSYYVGWAYLALFAAAMVDTAARGYGRQRALAAAALVVTVAAACLTYDDWYFSVRKLSLPLLASQRHTTRFMLIAILFSVLCVGEYLVRLWRPAPAWRRLGLSLALALFTGFLVFDLGRGVAPWRRFAGDDHLAYAELAARHESAYLTADILIHGNEKLDRQHYQIEPGELRLDLPADDVREVVLPALAGGRAAKVLKASTGALTMDDRGLILTLPAATRTVTLSVDRTPLYLGAAVSAASFAAMVGAFVWRAWRRRRPRTRPS